MTLRPLSVYNIPMETRPSRPRQHSSARLQMMDYLAHRNHTEKELRTKLGDKFPQEEIKKAIQFGKDKGWIASSKEDLQALSEEVAAVLKRKGKGPLYINQYLEEKGLVPISMDPAEELEKARELVENKYSDLNKMDRNEKAKVGRFLMSRGFDLETVRKVINE
ncbi:MAG: regulatory protein RecX [Pseudobdellovibrionaceae bacterium]